MIVVNGRY